MVHLVQAKMLFLGGHPPQQLTFSVHTSVRLSTAFVRLNSIGYLSPPQGSNDHRNPIGYLSPLQGSIVHQTSIGCLSPLKEQMSVKLNWISVRTSFLSKNVCESAPPTSHIRDFFWCG